MHVQQEFTVKEADDEHLKETQGVDLKLKNAALNANNHNADLYFKLKRNGIHFLHIAEKFSYLTLFSSFD